MMTRIRMTALVLAVLAVAGLGAMAAKEAGAGKEAAKQEMTPAAKATVEKVCPGGKVESVELTAKGPKAYEAMVKQGEAVTEVLVGADGTLRKVEAKVAADSLPAAVKAAIEKQASGAKVLEAEKETTHAKLKLVVLEKPEVVYDVKVQAGGKTISMDISADGKVLKAKESAPKAVEKK